MIMKVSQKTKIVIDYGLAAVGAFIGNLVGGGIVDPVIGAFGGFFVSDLVTYVETGKIPTQDIENQVISLVNQELQKQESKSTTAVTTPAKS
ncbi:MAG: hypothetical protein JRN20_09685 [Nitrososphaerota archaeon]|jgi:hypothetical protein|nr:hypothetical protein [Nitrososphaerota archaeon]